MKNRLSVLFLALMLFIFSIPAFSADYTRKISWNGISAYPAGDGTMIKLLEFDGSQNLAENNFLPFYFERFALESKSSDFKATLTSQIFDPIPPDIIAQIDIDNSIGSEIKIQTQTAFERKLPYAMVTFLPIRKNEITGQYEWLTSFTLVIDEIPLKSFNGANSAKTYKEHSVLAAGNWYKISVSKTGIYKISYQELSDIGINPASIDPRNIRIYGNGGGMLPENVTDFRYDDLQENAILVYGESDGTFNQGDYILFYGESASPVKYSSDENRIVKEMNLFADLTYYFITTDLGAGKRISTQATLTDTPNNIVNSYNDIIHYETDENNLIKSGRIWYGQKFDIFNDLINEYNITNLNLNSKMLFTVEAAASSDVSSSFSFFINNQEKIHLPIQAANSNNPTGPVAYAKFDSSYFYPASSSVTVKVTYNKSLSSSVGYLDYYTLNFKRDLAFLGGQMNFRDVKTATQELTSKYTLTKANGNVIIWNVSDPLNVQQVQAVLNGTELTYTLASSSLQEFVAFDGTALYSPKFVAKISNQDLHNTGAYDMVIITHPDFREQADRLAAFHRDFDNLSVFVTEPQLIYNEFSSGAQDVAAIRDFLKMLYDKAEPGQEPKYVLLFGDASYDLKDRVENNTNFVPTWESYQSLNPVSSYAKDDYYGLLDDGNDNLLDIGIGRFVVSTKEQAKSSVDKVIRYAVNTPENMGDWRNIVCLIADDEDGNLHLRQADTLASLLSNINKDLNIEKIYLDAYEQVSTPSGARYPDVTRDFTNRVERGALIINYVGHGGEGGLAHERILKISDITDWYNPNNMPVFITATCEFSRFDDPGRVSAGELVFLNENGGGIALFTTTRATYSSPNFSLNKSVYKYAFQRENGEYLRMGDILRLAKNESNDVVNKSKFSLLGDPALKLALPEYHAITAKINNIAITDMIDTIQALSKISVSGEIQDINGARLTDFNGVLYPTVYDKPSNYRTLGNDPASSPTTFSIQKNQLYKGKASIVNGEWEFEFIAPKDIAYQYGKGKISYYAHNNETDAAGYFGDAIIGGYNHFAEADNKGPNIRLFINDTNFVFGGLTDENPSMLAYIFDEHGINTVGNGIGHDILATLDDEQSFVLNNFYEAELDDFQRGTIQYPFSDLSNGLHRLNLRVWDIYNNSATTYTEFVVASSEEMAINSLLNYPNPFKYNTTFTFEHNQVEQPLEVVIRVYAMNGKLVKTIDDIYYAGGYKYKSTQWDGTDEKGSKLNAGMYVYKLLLRKDDGKVVEETSKLVLLK